MFKLYVMINSVACLCMLVFQKKNRGLIMVNFYSPFVACSNKGNVSHVAGAASFLNKYTDLK